jgi:hypothetical protein
MASAQVWMVFTGFSSVFVILDDSDGTSYMDVIASHRLSLRSVD